MNSNFIIFTCLTFLDLKYKSAEKSSRHFKWLTLTGTMQSCNFLFNF
jgi:hypothetical protein